jgi:hypothetical protein
MRSRLSIVLQELIDIQMTSVCVFILWIMVSAATIRGVVTGRYQSISGSDSEDLDNTSTENSISQDSPEKQV